MGIKDFGIVRGRNAFISFNGSMLQACNTWLVWFEMLFLEIGLRADISSGEVSPIVYGLFNNDGAHGLLKRKDYRSINMLFPFIFHFVKKLLDIERMGR